MKKLCFLFIGLLCFACSPKTSGTSAKAEKKRVVRFESAATSVCDCTQKLAGLTKDLRTALEESNQDKVGEISQQIEAEQPNFRTCIDKLEKEYADIDGDPEFEKKILVHLEKECPDVHELLQNM